MSLLERKIVLVSKDEQGNTCMDMPLTNIEQVEGLEVMQGAAESTDGTSGLVPAPGAGAATRYLRSDGTWSVPPSVTYNVATTSTDGLMSAADKTKLDGLEGEGIPVGDVVYRPYLKSGYVKANGATVNRSDYPRLVAFATANNLWTSDPANEPWKYGVGNGSTTMVLPDYRNRVIQGGDSPAKLEAGLPNIEGSFSVYTAYTPGDRYNVTNGAFDIEATNLPGESYTYRENTPKYTFNAARCSDIYGKSNTVQPSSMVLLPQIKY